VAEGGEEDARRRTIRWDDPGGSVEAAARLAGLPFLEAIRDGRLPAPPVSRLLGFSLTEVEVGRAVPTAELKVNFVRPVVTGTGRLRSEGRVIHAGRLATAEARLTDSSGKLYAHAVGTCLILAAR
jgi:thioesterase superfamily protein